MSYFAHETAVIDEGCTIGNGTKIWHFSHVMSNSTLGENCNVGQNVVISPDVVLGKNVKVQNNVSIYTGVICEDDVFLGPSMVFTNVINPRSAVIRKEEYLKTTVRKGASIGAKPACHAGGRGFESRPDRQITIKSRLTAGLFLLYRFSFQNIFTLFHLDLYFCLS